MRVPCRCASYGCINIEPPPHAHGTQTQYISFLTLQIPIALSLSQALDNIHVFCSPMECRGPRLGSILVTRRVDYAWSSSCTLPISKWWLPSRKLRGMAFKRRKQRIFPRRRRFWYTHQLRHSCVSSWRKERGYWCQLWWSNNTW